MPIQNLTITESDGRETVLIPQTAPPPFIRKDINLRVPDIGRRFVMIKHDTDVLGAPRQYSTTWDPDPRPAVVNTKWGLITKWNDRVYDYVALSEQWQWFLWNMLDWASGYLLPRGKIERFYTKTTNSGTFAEATPGSLTWVYVNLIEKSRSHTDSASAETGYRDYVTGRNPNATKPYAWLMRPCTGQLAMVKNDLGSKLELETIDLFKPCPTMDELEAKPWLYGWATQIHIDGRVTRYPQIKEAFEVQGLPPAGTPIPFMSMGGSVLIDKRACLELEPGAAWTPYL